MIYSLAPKNVEELIKTNACNACKHNNMPNFVRSNLLDHCYSKNLKVEFVLDLHGFGLSRMPSHCSVFHGPWIGAVLVGALPPARYSHQKVWQAWKSIIIFVYLNARLVPRFSLVSIGSFCRPHSPCLNAMCMSLSPSHPLFSMAQSTMTVTIGYIFQFIFFRVLSPIFVLGRIGRYPTHLFL